MAPLAVVILAICSSSATARPSSGISSQFDTAWKQSEGGFSAMLAVTADPEDFYDAWERPASPGYVPRLELAETTRRGESVTGIVFFMGCTPDPLGFCLGTIDFILYRNRSESDVLLLDLVIA